MTISAKDGGIFKPAAPYAKDAGLWKVVQNGYVKDAGLWKQFFQNILSAIASGSASGACNNGQVNSSPCGITTNSVTITATGGTGSYTYSWAKLSGDTYTVTSPSSASTTFSLSASTPSDHAAVYRCTVNDGTQTTSVDVNVTSSHQNLQ